MVKLYTGFGDCGFSSLDGKRRIKKCDTVFEVLGTIDELSSNLGLIKACLREKTYFDIIENIQCKLSDIMAKIAGSKNEKFDISERDIVELEEKIDKIFADKKFTLTIPGESEISAQFDIARCVARRLERVYVKMAGKYKKNKNILKYLNRLSDLLYALAREDFSN